MAESLVFKLEAINSDFNKALADASKKTENLEKNLTKVAKVSATAFAGLTGAIGLAVNEARKIEDINTQFEVLTGSVNGAKKAVQQLQEFSASTPFSFESVANAGKQLLAFGFEVDQITPKLQELGDVAAASGQDVGELTTIYGQVAAAGKLTGERLLQLQERAIPIGPALAQTLGVAESAVRDLVSQGKVDFKTFEQAFASLSKEGGFAFDGLKKSSQTLSGQISTIKDNFSLIAAEIGARFLPVVKGAATALLGFLTRLREDKALFETTVNFLKIGAAITGIITTISLAAIGFLKFQAVLIGVKTGLLAIGSAFAFLTSPISLVIGAITLIGGAIAALVTGWDDNLGFIENFTQNFAGRISTIFSGLGNIIKAAFNFDVEGIKDGYDEIKAAFASNTAEMEQIKNEVEQRRADRIAKEIQDEKDKQALLAQQEIDANAAREQRLAAQREVDKENQIAQAEEKAAIQEEINALEVEQNISFKESERQILAEHLAQQESMEIQSAKKRLLERRKFNKEYENADETSRKVILKTQELLNSEQFRNAQSLSQQNINLQRSSSSTISGIGKAAAITDIGTQSAVGAQAVFAQAVKTFPPPFGPAIGAALAAAQIAYGVERIAQVRGAQQGGLVEGTGFGDSVPFLLEPGELVVPRQNFSDVVNDAAARQEGGGAPGASQAVEVTIGFKDEAFEIIEEKILERREIGVGSL